MSAVWTPPASHVGRLGEPTTVPALLDARAGATPDAPFVTFGDVTRSYAEGVLAAEAAADALASIGVGRGDTLALMMANGLEVLDCWFGTSLLGAVLVPINTALRGDGLRHIALHCRARVAVCDADLAEVFDAAVPQGTGPEIRLIHGGEREGWTSLTDLLMGAHARAARPVVHPGDLAAVLYTSGTTGLPKGVMTCQNAYATTGFEYTQRYVQLGEDDRLWTCLPLFHINAQAITTVPSLISGRPMVLRSRFSASAFLDDVRATGSTVFNYIGAIIQILLKQPERPDDADNPLRITTGSSAPAEGWREFEARFGLKVVEIYGLTETAGVALASPPGDVRVGKCGVPVSWSEVRIQREDGTEADVDEPGEFVVRSKLPDIMFQGYLHDEAATADATRDGWFHSGDRGVRSDDGYFRFIDRLKDSIRRRGENISSYEVERVVNSHPAVAESAAVGVPSELGEDEVMVVVVPRDGATIDPADLVAFCAERMATFQVPTFVKVVPKLPKTPTEKVRKVELRAAGSAGAWSRS